MQVEYTWTTDDLQLMGVHYPSKDNKTCLLWVHGMSGNFIENRFANIIGRELSQQGIAFLFGHNRGYGHINDINTRAKKSDGSHKSRRFGAIYERFTDCLLDIETWVEKIEKLGYQNIFVLGHSLGCNKLIHYFYKKKPNNWQGVILASPPDMVGLAQLEEYPHKSFQEVLAEARENIENGRPRELLSDLLWDWYNLSSQTFIDLSVEGGPADNLPIKRSPDKFPELAAINVPILSVLGEKDDVIIRSLEKDLELIREKATSCPNFSKEIIKQGNHTYDGQEKDLAAVLIKWINKINV